MCQSLGGICASDEDCCQGVCYSELCVSQVPTKNNPKKVSILAPAYDRTYTAIAVRVEDEEHRPIAGVRVYIITPSSEVRDMVTDSAGEITFLAQEEGWYSYSVPDYAVVSTSSTYVSRETGFTPVCGDTICSGDESCSSCSTDCGTCVLKKQEASKGTDWWIVGLIALGAAGFFGFAALAAAGGYWYFKVKKPKAEKGKPEAEPKQQEKIYEEPEKPSS